MSLWFVILSSEYDEISIVRTKLINEYIVLILCCKLLDYLFLNWKIQEYFHLKINLIILKFWLKKECE